MSAGLPVDRWTFLRGVAAGAAAVGLGLAAASGRCGGGVGLEINVRRAVVVDDAFDVVAKVAAGVQPGQVIVYHAWEPYQFPGGRGSQEPVESPWKAIHLAGEYGQLHYRMYYSAPGHAPRGTPVEVERIGPRGASA